MGKGKSEDAGPGAKAKAQSAAAKKEAEAAAAAAKEKRVEEQWEDGANARAAARAKEAADKEAARLAAKAAKEAAEANDSAELSKMRVPAGKARKAANAGKGKEDFSMLDAYLDSTKKKADKAKPASASNVTKQVDPLLLPNLNRVLAAQAAEGHVDATGLDNALAALGVDEGKPGEKGPSRKAAYAAFEEEAMARLKVEFPTLKRSQLLEKIWKEWERSPLNPDNKQP